jgi:hypothetical protein
VTQSIRSLESALRDAGMSAAEAKRTASRRIAELATLSNEGNSTMSPTAFARALDKFAPR